MLPGLKSLPQPLGQGLFSKRPCFAILELASGDKTRSERGRGLDVDCREAITGIVWGLLELTGVPKVNPRDASLPVSRGTTNQRYHTMKLLVVLKILELCDHSRNLSLWLRLWRAGPLFCDNFGMLLCWRRLA